MPNEPADPPLDDELEWPFKSDKVEEDPNHLFADGVMHREALELVRALLDLPGGGVGYMEGSLEPKARRVLAVASRRIRRNEPLPKEFLFLLYAVIEKRLAGEISSLDVGFGLKRGRGRPPHDPAVSDPIVYAFYGAAYKKREEGGTSEEQRQAGFEAAFKAHHRLTMDEMRRNAIDEADIQRRVKKTEAVLAERGLLVKTI
jgi:hypothetical protein